MEQTTIFGEVEVKALDTLKILKGSEVVSLLDDEEFISAWSTLYLNCPWGTVFQSPEFVATWYKMYKHLYLAILLIVKINGKLVGLLPLTKQLKSFTLIGAGADQAEYQGWLAEPFNGNNFIISALTLLQKEFPGHDLFFKFMPPDTPLQWVETSSGSLQKHTLLKPFRRPLIYLNIPNISTTLLSKDFKNKRNRLKRLGELSLERITDKNRFEAVLDELVLQFEFRKAAMLNLYPFKSNSLKRDFLLSMFEQNLLHVVVLKVDDKIIASTVGTLGKNCVHGVGINTHAPSYSCFSPGKVIFTMLAQQLILEETSLYDLSPGDAAYKDWLANGQDIVYRLHIANNVKSYAIIRFLEPLSVYLKNRIVKAGLNNQVLKIKFSKFKDRLMAGRLSHIRTLFNESSGLEATNIKNKTFLINSVLDYNNASFTINKDNLRDLLCFNQNGSGLTKWQFLEEAENKFHNGLHVYTYTEDDILLSCAWLDVKKADSPLPDGALILDGFYCHPSLRKQFGNFLNSVATVISGTEQFKNIYATVKPHDKLLIKALTNAGFAETAN